MLQSSGKPQVANLVMHLTGYCGLRPLPPADDEFCWADWTAGAREVSADEESQRNPYLRTLSKRNHQQTVRITVLPEG
jgi:hypothetical protein